MKLLGLCSVLYFFIVNMNNQFGYVCLVVI